MDITLSSSTQKLLEARMKKGGFASPDEAIRAALESMDVGNYEDVDEETRAAIEEGLEQADRGEIIPVDEAFARLRRKHRGL